MDALNAKTDAERRAFFQWADCAFSDQSGGQLADKNDLTFFSDRFLPKLNDTQRQQLLAKLKGQ
jgi:hypothetical protein